LSCTEDQKIRGGDNYSDIVVDMDVVNGKPDPKTANYLSIGYRDSAGKDITSGTMILVAPAGDKTANLYGYSYTGPVVGWAAQETGNITIPYVIGELDTTDPQAWTIDDNGNPTSAVATARQIISDLPLSYDVALGAFTPIS
jgi:hypothetical protein